MCLVRFSSRSRPDVGAWRPRKWRFSSRGGAKCAPSGQFGCAGGAACVCWRGAIVRQPRRYRNGPQSALAGPSRRAEERDQARPTPMRPGRLEGLFSSRLGWWAAHVPTHGSAGFPGSAPPGPPITPRTPRTATAPVTGPTFRANGPALSLPRKCAEPTTAPARSRWRIR